MVLAVLALVLPCVATLFAGVITESFKALVKSGDKPEAANCDRKVMAPESNPVARSGDSQGQSGMGFCFYCHVPVCASHWIFLCLFASL